MSIKRNRGRQWLEWQQRVVTVAQIAGVAGCVWLLIALFSGEMGLFRYWSMRDYARNLEHELAALHRENALLNNDITRLQRDRTKVEQLAREQLGYVRKGETVYQLAPDLEKKPDSPSKP